MYKPDDQILSTRHNNWDHWYKQMLESFKASPAKILLHCDPRSQQEAFPFIFGRLKLFSGWP